VVKTGRGRLMQTALAYGLRGGVALLLLAAAIPAWCQGPRPNEPLQPLRPIPNLDARKVKLGDQLFHDPRLSVDNSISCESCHQLASNGADHRPRSLGVGGAEGSIKAPTVYNSGYNFVQFWDGRAATLEEQVGGPVNNPLEMASNWEQVVAKLQQDPKLISAFAAIYPEGITPETISNAIATFERSLVTTNAPFDRWLLGDDTALSEKELQGYRLFNSYGCSSCHQGRNVGGNLYAYMGAMGDYFADRGGEVTTADLGRFNVTGDPADRFFFKVPSLRLAVLQKYYFHDASETSLKQAIQTMGRYQLGRIIPSADATAIAAFLGSLVGNNPRLQR
jgi:cytochrome c peroxidase